MGMGGLVAAAILMAICAVTDGVKVALGNRGMTEAARQCAKDWKAWRAVVHM